MLAGRWSLAIHSRSEGKTLVLPMVKVTGLLTTTLTGRPLWTGVADRRRSLRRAGSQG